MAGEAQWTFVGGQDPLTFDAPATLRNDQVGKSLRFRERENGIELVWDDADDLANVTVRRPLGPAGPVRFGDSLGIEVDGGGFLRYVERDVGINLDWSNSMKDQWEVTGGPIGEEVRAGQRAALLNTAHGDHLVYGERSKGINLRWYADELLLNQHVWGYPPLPIPNRFRGPGREAAQILAKGEARIVTLFHGRVDNELDWHVYVSLSPEDRRDLVGHLRSHARGVGGLTERDLDQLYSELMVLDASREPWLAGDDRFFSADVSEAFALPQAAWDYSEEAGEDQSEALDVTSDSALTTRAALVRLQGCFVNDAAHGFLPEIHPLDSIAFALDGRGRPLTVGADARDWPATLVTWRIGVFTNSTVHRINSADYVEHDRETTWFLDLPRNAIQDRVQGRMTVETTYPGFTNRGRGAEDVDDARPTANDRYEDYGKVEDSAIVVRDPRDNQFRLRVRVRMERPDRWGGMFLADYTIRSRGRAADDPAIARPEATTR